MSSTTRPDSAQLGAYKLVMETQPDVAEGADVNTTNRFPSTDSSQRRGTRFRAFRLLSLT